MLEGFQKRFLNDVLGIFQIVCDILSDSQEFAVVSLYELLESRYVSMLRGVNEIQIIPGHRFLYELCQACRHIVQPRFGTEQLLRTPMIL